jgi:hypothetical protein
MATREHANPPISIPPQHLAGWDNENFGLKGRGAGTFALRYKNAAGVWQNQNAALQNTHSGAGVIPPARSSSHPLTAFTVSGVGGLPGRTISIVQPWSVTI